MKGLKIMDKITLIIQKDSVTNWGFIVYKNNEYWYSQIGYDTRQEAETDALNSLRGMYSKSPSCRKVEYTFDPIA
jgi:hypothetical protein